MRLTDLSVKALAPPERGQKIYRADDIKGFGVRVSQGGTKTFVLVHGADRQFTTIGRYPVISLQEARGEAKRLMAEVTLGKRRPKVISFLDALDSFVATRKEKNRPSTAYETERLLRVNFKALHLKQLSDIRAHHITDITDSLVRDGKRSLALHAFNAAHTFLRFCSQRHYIDTSPIADTEKPTNNGSRERVLSDDELRTVWFAADELGGHFGGIVKLLILTGQRRGEIGSLRADWVTIDSDQTELCLPGTLTKNRRTHTFPISALAADILRSNITEATTILFPARGSTTTPFNGWSKAKAQLDAKAKIAPWTLHDLRRTYATNLQRLGIRLEVIESLLNHVSGSRAGIVGVYNRHRYEQEMREAVTAYDAWFTETILQVEEL